MFELTKILNNPLAKKGRQLSNVAALLSADDAFYYNPTYLTDSKIELSKFRSNIVKLNELLLKYSKLLKDKLSPVLIDEKIVWAFKLQANNSVEVLSDEISLIVIREQYENDLLKFLASSNISSFVLNLHFKYSRNEIIDLGYSDSFDNHIQHSFRVKNNHDIRISISQFIKIVKLHVHAE